MDEEELRQALQALHSTTFGWALDCCDRNLEEAEDVVQGSYVKILNGSARFNGRSSLKTFLFGVIRRTAAEERRRRLLRHLAFARWFERRPERGVKDPESSARESERSRRLLVALTRLPRRQREVLHLVFYQDCTVDEAARVMEISAGSARTHFDRGKKRLRRLLGSRGTDESA